MDKQDDNIYFSPSDITTFVESPFASWMNRYKLEFPEKAPDADEDDGLSTSLQARGYRHEEELLKQFKEQGLSIANIKDKALGENCSWDERFATTKKAMLDGKDIIYQAALGFEKFRGFTDFLVKKTGKSRLGDYHYEIWDTKLALSVKPKFVIQLCCYAEMLESMQGVLPASLIIVLGNNKEEVLVTCNYYYYYLAIKAKFLETQAVFNKNDMPNPADSKSFCRWTTIAERILNECDHLSRVANITRAQINRLNNAGITTTKALANLKEYRVLGIRAEQLVKLQRQADIQLRTNGKIPPLFEVITENSSSLGLALLPPCSTNDVYFDIEGFPLEEDGLEYLWGATYFDEKGESRFIDFWAHNEQQEKKAFSDFIMWVYSRWQNDPSMHIYHYANYEIAACKRLMGRYGLCENEVDQLLRNEVFVDLYKIVKSGLRIGEPKYSIKNVEHLYRGQRETEVGTGGDSVAVYDAWRENPDGGTWQESKVLNDIREYNKDDCYSTQELAQWLRTEQQKYQISYVGISEHKEAPVNEAADERQMLRDRLLEKSQSQHEGESELTENLAWMLEFHRRENKPVHWRKFDRLGQTDDDLYDDMDCLVYCSRTDREPFKPTPKAKNLAYEYQFDPNQEFKGGKKQYTVLGKETDDGKELKLTFVPGGSDLEKGLICLQMKEEIKDPITLIPNEFVNPEPIPTALKNQITAFENKKLQQTAIIDFLTRSHPRIEGISLGDDIITSHDPDERLEQIIQVVKNLEHSYLPIQGPPGAGKTFTGKHIIAALLKQGKKIGISSNSHKAINNLLFSTVKYCRKKGIKAHFVCGKDVDNGAPDLNVTVMMHITA